MKRNVIALLLGAFALLLTSSASAHIGDKIYLIFEISAEDLADIDIKDGSIADWEDVVGEPSLLATDFFADPTVGAGAQYDPADLDYRIWLAYDGSRGHLYLAMERIDDIYINEYAGGDPGTVWRQDSIEFMVDGDHSGGRYNFNGVEGRTDEENKLDFNRTAQKYNATYTVPDGRHMAYPGGGQWVNVLPYADAGGAAVGAGPTTAVLEMFVTPFDDLIWNDEAASTASSVASGDIIGFQIAVPDFDTEPSEYQAYHTLSGQAQTFRYSERFVDGRLVGIGGGGGTAVESTSWARIKTSFN